MLSPASSGEAPWFPEAYQFHYGGPKRRSLGTLHGKQILAQGWGEEPLPWSSVGHAQDNCMSLEPPNLCINLYGLSCVPFPFQKVSPPYSLRVSRGGIRRSPAHRKLVAPSLTNNTAILLGTGILFSQRSSIESISPIVLSYGYCRLHHCCTR